MCVLYSRCHQDWRPKYGSKHGSKSLKVCKHVDNLEFSGCSTICKGFEPYPDGKKDETVHNQTIFGTVTNNIDEIRSQYWINNNDVTVEPWKHLLSIITIWWSVKMRRNTSNDSSVDDDIACTIIAAYWCIPLTKTEGDNQIFRFGLQDH